MDVGEPKMAKNICVPVGSLRKEYYGKKTAGVLAGLSPEDSNVSFVGIGDLEL
jgi:hypothetical protein